MGIVSWHRRQNKTNQNKTHTKIHRHEERQSKSLVTKLQNWPGLPMGFGNANDKVVSSVPCTGTAEEHTLAMNFACCIALGWEQHSGCACICPRITKAVRLISEATHVCIDYTQVWTDTSVSQVTGWLYAESTVPAAHSTGWIISKFLPFPEYKVPSYSGPETVPTSYFWEITSVFNNGLLICWWYFPE